MQVGFNLEVGGYFSIKRNAVSFWGDTWVRQDQVVAYCKALLEVFRCGLQPAGTTAPSGVPLLVCARAALWPDRCCDKRGPCLSTASAQRAASHSLTGSASQSVVLTHPSPPRP